jgi:periplasmic protein TonB
MLNVLLESNAKRTRRTGGTLASMLAHATLIAGAIMLTTRGAVARPKGDRETVLPPYIPRTVVPTPVIHEPQMTSTIAVMPTAPSMPRVDQIPTSIPPIDVDIHAPIVSDDDLGHRGFGEAGGPTNGPVGVGRAPEGVLEERYVDRSPRILGNPISPDFPTSLRQRGMNGRVSVQFVVDTLGRAEMRGLRVVEATDSLFAQSVRAVLGRYRFSPGEVGGQKVRTLVQLPFDFTVVR